jgi:hypothetical protein
LASGNDGHVLFSLELTKTPVQFFAALHRNSLYSA